MINIKDSVEITFGGPEPTLHVCGLKAMNVPPPSFLQNLTLDCKPVGIKSRKYTTDDSKFIEAETRKLLADGIIEPGNSPWRAQVLLTTDERHKKRMVIHYIQTINRFTQLDAYPLPNINNMVQKIAQYSVYSTIDLRSAYHQIPLKDEDKPYTAFESSGRLCQLNCIPVGVTNGVAGLQRSIDDVISKENTKDTFAFVDNITICEKTQKEHDENLEKFLQAAKNYNMIFNEEKSVFSTDTLTLFGSVISKVTIKPDPERLRPLKELPPPQNTAAQRRVIGMFSYYSKWIPKFSEKIRPLIQNKQFSVSESPLQVFEQLKLDIENSVIYAIDDSIPFEVETDASDFAIAATLNQAGRPVAFFSPPLEPSEQNHSSMEKDAMLQ